MELGEDQLPEVERSLTDDITMEVDEQEPGAESDATFHLTAELSFARSNRASWCGGLLARQWTWQGMAAAIPRATVQSIAHTVSSAHSSTASIHCEQIRVKESASVPNSVAMEKEGLVRSMVKLEEQGVAIRSLTTGLKKKLKLAAKSKGCSSIQLWIEAIKNHLYWTAAMGDGDGELILSIWGSLLNHVCNKHVGHQGAILRMPT
ncbi:hypothetical protein HPB48_017797 [Haemaphysalis longicornis]|uniref:Uncharacterized protein n=1 Tax=Haemaphysalis longicornis TaxID=44386 RepID=A0A9J6FX59_HAELO|nr:hypothetical protein HPB48_017797 [Haemaphysalis longicornis]